MLTTKRINAPFAIKKNNCTSKTTKKGSANLSRQASWLKRDQHSITFEIQRRFLSVNTKKLEAIDS